MQCSQISKAKNPGLNLKIPHQLQILQNTPDWFWDSAHKEHKCKQVLPNEVRILNESYSITNFGGWDKWQHVFLFQRRQGLWDFFENHVMRLRITITKLLHSRHIWVQICCWSWSYYLQLYSCSTLQCEDPHFFFTQSQRNLPLSPFKNSDLVASFLAHILCLFLSLSP